MYFLLLILLHSIIYSQSTATLAPEYVYQNAKPTFIDINLHFTESYMYRGTVKTDLTLEAPSTYVKLRAGPMVIQSAELSHMSNETIVKTWTSPDIEHENGYVTFRVAPQETLGEYETYLLTVNFVGIIQNGPGIGMRHIEYVDPVSGEVFSYIVAAFKYEGAHYAFPCFDDFRTRVRMSLTVRHNYYTVKAATSAGAPAIVRSSEPSPVLTTKWPPTDDIPPSLFSLTIGNFSRTLDYLDPQATMPLVVFFRKDYGDASHDSVTQALHISRSIVHAFERFLEVKYKPQKLAIVMLPELDSRILDGWGLFYFPEEFFPVVSKMEMFQLQLAVAGKVGHHYFGNQVVAEDYEHFWINLGMVEFLKYKVLKEENRDSMKFMEIESQQMIQRYDVDENEFVLNEHSLEAETMIAKKAGSIMKMFNKVDSTVISKHAIQYYLKEKTFQPVSIDDFAIAFDVAIKSYHELRRNFTFLEVLRSWTEQKGYPLITISLKNNFVMISQEKFSYDRENSTARWIIPVQMPCSLGSPVEFFWITDANEYFQCTFSIFNLNYLNVPHEGYYRVNYDNGLWDDFVNELNSDQYTRLSTMKRTHLVDDVMNLARAGYVTYERVWSVLVYLKREREYFPWAAANENLKLLLRLTRDSEESRNLKKFIHRLVKPLATSLDFNPSTNLSRISLVNLVIDLSSRIDRPIGVTKKFGGVDKVDPNFQGAAGCSYIRTASLETVNDMYEREFVHFNSSSASKRRFYLRCLTCNNHPAILQKLIHQTSPEGNYIPKPERAKTRQLILENVEGLEGVRASLEYLAKLIKPLETYKNTENTRNSSYVREKLNLPDIKEFMTLLGNYITTPETFEAFKELASSGLFKKTEKKKLLKVPTRNLKWRERFLKDFGFSTMQDESWLSKISNWFSK